MSDTVIETRDLTRYFGNRKAVDGLTMAVPRGSVFAFLGRNGSGKTTTIRMLLGLLDPTRGSSTILGFDSQSLPPEARARIGYVSESHTLYDRMTVRQNGKYHASFFRTWNQKVFDAVVGQFHLSLDTIASQLSRGERAGLSLAMTMAPEPELLVLDDPALGLDPVARRSLLESMIYVTRGANRTILFSSHLIEDVERVADYLAILDRSVLRACCSVESFRSHVRQFILRYPTGTIPPSDLTGLTGLIHARRGLGELRLTIAGTTEATRQKLQGLGAASIEETPLALSDALIGYLGDRPSGAAPGFLLEDTAGLQMAGGAL